MFHIVIQRCNRDLSRFSTKTRSKMTKGLRSGFATASPLLSGVANGVLLHCGAAQSGRSRRQSGSLPNGLGLTREIDEIARLFDAPVFSKRSLSSSPVAWDAIDFASDPAIPANGCFDALDPRSELLGIHDQSGLSVQFDFLGSGTPGSQQFQRIDSTSYLSRRELVRLDWDDLQSPAVASRRHAPVGCPRSCAADRDGAP